MLKLLSSVLILALSVGVARADGHDPGAENSLIQWLLDVDANMRAPQRERRRLEACLSTLRIVTHADVRRDGEATVADIPISNTLPVAISGLVVRPLDGDLRRMRMDGRSAVSFDRLAPGESLSHQLVIDRITGHVVGDRVVALIALDAELETGQWIVSDVLLPHLLEGADIPDWGRQVLSICAA